MTGPAISTTEPQVTETATQNEPVADQFAAEREATRQATIAEAAATYNPVIQQNARERAELQRQIDELRTANAPRAEPVSGADFLQDPSRHIASIVAAEIRNQVAPLNDFVQQTQRQSAYTNLKNQLRMDPGFAAILPQIEAELDQQASGLNPMRIEAIAMMAQTLYGQKAMRGLLTPVPTIPLNTQPVVNRPVNPSPTPSAPANNTQAPVVKVNLTEDERRIARFNNMTDEQYHAYMHSDGSVADMAKIK